MPFQRRGLFIVLEGIDGSGTSTMILPLEEHIKSIPQYPEVITTCEPWISVYGKEIRRILRGHIDYSITPLEISRLFVEDSVIHNRELIKPALRAGKIVLSDRYRGSSFAYQTTDGVSLEKVLGLHEEEGDQLEIPDVTFFLDVSAAIGKERLATREETQERFDLYEFQRGVVDNYRRLKHIKYFGKFVTIDASNPPDQVAKDICDSFDKLYEERFG